MSEAAPRASFFELVRALEAQAPQATPLGGDGPVAAEVVRLRAHPSLGFPTRDVHAVDVVDTPSGPRTRLTVTFHGLYGTDGPLPPHDTEALLRDDDTVARDFLDVFNHRALALRYRAWARTRPHAAGARWADTPVGRALHALVDPLDAGASAWDTAALRWRGARTPQGLAEAVAAILPGVSVDVVGCVPQQVPIPDDQRLRLGKAACALGHDTVLGDRAWDATGRFEVRLGPVDRETFDACSPGGALHGKIAATVDAWRDTPLTWSLVVWLAAEAVPTARLGSTSRLGVDTWLGRPPHVAALHARPARTHAPGGVP